MNKIRRKQLQEASELIAKAQGIIENVKDEEQEAHDNLPESIQYGEKGQQMEEYIDMLDEAYGQCGGFWNWQRITFEKTLRIA